MVELDEPRSVWIAKWLAHLLVVAGAALVPVGFLFDRRLWYVASAMLLVGAIVLIWERSRRRDRDDVDLDVESYAPRGPSAGTVRQSRQLQDTLDGDDD